MMIVNIQIRNWALQMGQERRSQEITIQRIPISIQRIPTNVSELTIDSSSSWTIQPVCLVCLHIQRGRNWASILLIYEGI